MKLIVRVDGHDAIPVRAIPFLTDWQKFTPVELAAVLAQFEDAILANGMRNLGAYRVTDDGVVAIPAHWWSRFTYRELQALSDSIKARQETSETGYQDWRMQSVGVLPSGVFVWRDEFETGYAQSIDKWQRVAGTVLKGLELNLNPFLPTKYKPSLILEGFDISLPAQTLAPVADSASTDTATPGLVVGGDDAPTPLPLTTLDIAHCFDGLHWNESQWKTNLGKFGQKGKPPKWLGDDCIAIPGKRGGSETRWYPVRIGAGLAANKDIEPRTIRARFRTNRLLAEWFDAWENYESEYLTTE